VWREESLADKVEREATHTSVVFQVLVLSQHHCWFFCYVKNLLPLLRGSFDSQVLRVPDVIIPLSESVLPRGKRHKVMAPALGQILGKYCSCGPEVSASTMKCQPRPGQDCEAGCGESLFQFLRSCVHFLYP